MAAATPPILYTSDGWMRARNRPLGALGGAGVACVLALLDDPDLAHPPMECLFTDSARQAPPPDGLKSKRVIGLDGIREGATVASAAGETLGRLTLDFPASSINANAYSLKTSWPRPGSPLSAHGLGANAVKICARMLNRLNEEIGITVSDTLVCPSPWECEVIFGVKKETDASRVLEAAQAGRSLIMEEYANFFPEIKISCEETAPLSFADENHSAALIKTLWLLPCGTVYPHPEKPGEALGSYGIARLFTENKTVSLEAVCRANFPCNLDELEKILQGYAGLLGARYKTISRRPPYRAPDNSHLAKVWEDVYFHNTGRQLESLFTHQSLQTAGICEALGGGIDMIMVAPTIENPDTQNERLDIESFARMYQYLKDILEII
jgi:dipeptidase D